jgi:hypothetical protein
MPKRPTPQELGRQQEATYAKRWGFAMVPGSGATPRAMLDVGKGRIIVSLKRTVDGSIRITADMLREARAGASGPRARATDIIPALAFYLEDGDEDWTALPTDVLMDILRGDIQVEAPESSVREQRRAAAIPRALRP